MNTLTEQEKREEYLEESIRRLVREKIEWENKAHLLEKKLSSADVINNNFDEKEKDTEFLQQVGELVRPIVHDLKGSLQAIASANQLMSEILKTEEKIDLHKIEDSITRNRKVLSTIFGRLNDLSYLGGKYVRGFDKVNLNEVINENIEMIRLRYDKCNIEVHIPDEPLVIVADRESLNQIVSNLVINAVEASGPKKINITLSAKQTDRQIELTVTDTGIGIYEREKDKIFNLHYTTKKTGFGIGLHLVKKAVELHRGQIKVESNQGIGTTFMVTLPINQEVNDGNNT